MYEDKLSNKTNIIKKTKIRNVCESLFPTNWKISGYLTTSNDPTINKAKLLNIIVLKS